MSKYSCKVEPSPFPLACVEERMSKYEEKKKKNYESSQKNILENIKSRLTDKKTNKTP